MKLLQVEGTRVPVPHSWRRHFLWVYSVHFVFKFYLLTTSLVSLSVQKTPHNMAVISSLRPVFSLVLFKRHFFDCTEKSIKSLLRCNVVFTFKLILLFLQISFTCHYTRLTTIMNVS